MGQSSNFGALGELDPPDTIKIPLWPPVSYSPSTPPPPPSLLRGDILGAAGGIDKDMDEVRTKLPTGAFFQLRLMVSNNYRHGITP